MPLTKICIVSLHLFAVELPAPALVGRTAFGFVFKNTAAAVGTWVWVMPEVTVYSPGEISHGCDYGEAYNYGLHEKKRLNSDSKFGVKMPLPIDSRISPRLQKRPSASSVLLGFTLPSNAIL